jgi:fluoroacetyl-CoA thioesterase
MDLDQLIQPQMRREEIFVVEDTHTAMHVGSGASRVLATPWMIAFMERAAHRLLAAVLPAGFTSVGVLVNIRHLAPTPAGSQVRVSAEVLEVDGMKVKFQVEVWDEQEQAGSGIHERFVIDTERFLRRVEKKRILLDQP